jgi:predicted nucleotidyltransferase
LLRLGYFGSYARGDAGVGSDLDIVAVIRESETPFERRAIAWDLNPLPVPAEILFARMLEQEAVWL